MGPVGELPRSMGSRPCASLGGEVRSLRESSSQTLPTRVMAISVIGLYGRARGAPRVSALPSLRGVRRWPACRREEEREDAGTKELVFCDRPVRLAKLRAAFRWQDAPIEDEVDAGTVVAEINPVDDGRCPRRRRGDVADEGRRERGPSAPAGRARRRPRSPRALLAVPARAQADQLDQSLARPGHPKSHVRPSDRIEGQVGVQLRATKRSKEVAERAAERGAPAIVQLGRRQLATRKEGCAVERPTVFGRRLPELGRDGDRQRQERRKLR